MPGEGASMTAATTRRPYEGWFATAARLALASAPRDGWRVEAGEHAVIVMYSSQRDRGAFDKGARNDELVLEIAASELRPGAALDLARCRPRYQRGGSKLEYVSCAVTGEVHLEQVGPHAVRGSFSLHATAPQLDVRGLGDVEATGTFQLDLCAR
jgi:hypothetical protein